MSTTIAHFTSFQRKWLLYKDPCTRKVRLNSLECGGCGDIIICGNEYDLTRWLKHRSSCTGVEILEETQYWDHPYCKSYSGSFTSLPTPPSDPNSLPRRWPFFVRLAISLPVLFKCRPSGLSH
ncbi:hypothetical protein CONPUDRAFT_137847 [Coniophora puteana RWD-64-598 SS2]|uniref:MYND-type domain-containing protein n=1 Tax=Coniophora puteana (strain RWD-64-598) TaxID=741705 RepID=A0A5M3MKZ9_CONPW|nr:uncharacterized protein CONPUDRAFT_137847 [Coniophora puteana RWD-64-598 SS2]EIW79494.1 hypothetical protein CONPUDRAFT_137847 [Coniophora puteana RWD-64-598 SS2]